MVTPLFEPYMSSIISLSVVIITDVYQSLIMDVLYVVIITNVYYSLILDVLSVIIFTNVDEMFNIGWT